MIRCTAVITTSKRFFYMFDINVVAATGTNRKVIVLKASGTLNHHSCGHIRILTMMTWFRELCLNDSFLVEREKPWERGCLGQTHCHFPHHCFQNDFPLRHYCHYGHCHHHLRVSRSLNKLAFLFLVNRSIAIPSRKVLSALGLTTSSLWGSNTYSTNDICDGN